MLKIFISDARLASWILFENFLFQNILNESARRLQYVTHVLFSQLTVEKEFFIPVIEICSKSGM